jgi:hypothetical protein
MKQIILAITLLIILSAETAWGAESASKNGEFWVGTCTCQCKGVELTASVAYKPGISEDGATIAKKLCREQCARNCGGYTECPVQNDANCGTCCRTFCGSLGEKCELSCSSTCSYRDLVNGIVQVIYLAAGIIGALMIVINGLRMVTSQDPNDRNAAKNGIIFVIIALIIIILAATLVGLFMNSAMTPQT